MKLAESETLEFKLSTSELKEAVISISAILNKHGSGTLYFGIKDDGTVVGQSISKSTLREVGRVISENIDPKIFPTIEKVQLEGHDCLKISFSGNDGPYLAYGRAYLRVSDENRKASAREMSHMFSEQKGHTSKWDSEVSEKKLADVNEKIVKDFVRKANLAGRIDFKFAGTKRTLNKLALLDGERLLKAGEVLFCDENPLRVQAAVFAGTDKLTFLDIREFEGTLFDLMAKTETYVKEHMDWRVEFGALERKEIPEIPIDALREAIVNSFCHKDYRNPKGNELAIFRDRVEIYNPGEFPDGYTPDDFITGNEHSILRNPKLAEVLFASKDIERWGSGLKRISDECRKNGVKVNFKARKSGFAVVFRRNAKPETKDAVKSLSPNEGKEKTVEKTVEKIIAAIRENPRISQRELGEITGLTRRGVEWNLKKLKAEGRLRRVGPAKGGHWEVAD
ncbi:MAG: ATP-binding protein [Thermoplasmata archaeon]|nr:ATP-binding protein [Thermoplasmata archaeon]